jgi:hypothetical protein
MRHLGRWALVYSIAIVGGIWFAWRAFGAGPVERALVVISVLVVLVSLVFKERRTGARPSLGTFFWAAFGSGYSAWLYYVLSASWWSKALLEAVVVMPAMVRANRLLRADVRYGQYRREEAAKAMAGRVMAGDRTAGPFALYLRPFASTGRLPTEQLPPTIGGGTEIPSHLDLETMLGRALRDRCPVVALGRSGDIAEGPARIATSDEEWRSLMAGLADQAAFIVMVPLASPSTLWELRWLTEHDLLGKVLMVMPESPGTVPSGVIRTTENDRVFDAGIQCWDPEEHQLNLAKEWRQATRAAREIGVELPPLAAVGALFTIDATTGQVARILPLALSTITVRRRVGYLRAAITTLGLFNADENPPPDPASALARAVFFRDATLDYALTRAADGFLLWGDTRAAAVFLGRALAESPRRPGFAHGYLNTLPEKAHYRSRLGDDEAVARYQAAIPAFQEDPELAALVARN